MTYQTVNPATGAVVKTFPDISNAELEGVVTKAHDCYQKDWSRRSIKDRAKILSAAAAKLRENADEYAGYITLEMGKLLDVSHAEVQLSAAILDYYAQNAEKFKEAQPVPGVPGAVLETRPIGVILGIEPWNFPYYQVARVAGPQLMVGNTLIIKHAENVPQCALAFARLFEEAGAPEGAYTNVFAAVDQIGSVIDDVRVRGVTVTGSERAGAAVAERAGRALKKTVMELGGSDPFIVLEDAPLEHAMDMAVFGRMFNTGQSCVSSKRLIVVGKERGRQFQEGFTSRMASLTAGDPTDATTTLGPVSSERAMNVLLDQIKAAREGGAKVTTGGGRVDRPGFYVQATVLIDIKPGNPIYSQELFGPVASIYVVDSEDDAIKLANDSPYGLGGVVFSADMERGRRVAEQIESGMVWVNQPPWTGPELPFGGIKNSGFGRELAEVGFGEFVNRKMISVVPSGSAPWGPVPVN
ncbi:NAD-dependent succinate-semialdehyde dehydrogenase [Paraburkholderia dipogonis]|uniref:NAD-dependent succinate-semialdehyde dehydrogenase n=1 Tax=Paraburkholderia dipogonis TaxID=1211383 RepID=A0A4Y8MWW9_9BURK|nr:NAD-dependent succinate-semialdehyde dehydrogenase [Paraburkholderia dipogonis]TFE41909.1 NAD-dependent succinate-semialdehyde dehydrogenase [Paraburkholderia dipogonis]